MRYINSSFLIVLIFLLYSGNLKPKPYCVKYIPVYEPRKGMNIPNYCNNPGNITSGVERYDTLAIGAYSTGKHSFLIFPDANTGWRALRMRVMASSNENIRSFVYRYVGARDERYLRKVTSGTGKGRVSDYPLDSVVKMIATLEGFTTGRKIIYKVKW